MSAGPGRSRRFLDRPGAVRAAAAAALVLVFVALVGPSLLTTRPVPTASTGPVATLSGSGSGSPAPSENPWTALELAPYAAVADLVPSDVDRLGVAATTTFSLASRTNVPAADLAKGLAATPPIEFTVEPGANPAFAVIRPTRALDGGTRYRWDLSAPDGAPAGSWLFTARQPLHVSGTLPGDQAIGVPRNSGIEVTFDQDGATGVTDHVTLTPAVRGRFEQHGRTWAFVPDQPLAPTTIYTLTVRAGIGVDGSTEQLEDDVVVRFETAAAGTTPPRIEFERPIVEVRPNVEPVVMVGFESEDGEAGAGGDRPTVEVYRLPTLSAAIDAATHLTGDVGWAVAAPEAVVATAELDRVARVTAETLAWDYGSLLHVPVRLPAGRYLLQIDQAGGPAQMLLQVTDLGAYALVTTVSTVVWVNDLARDAALAGAEVTLVGGADLGTTAADGLLTVSTPVGLATRPEEDGPTAAAELLVVSAPGGRAMLVPLGLRRHWAYEQGLGSYGGTTSPYWTLFRTDRYAYRQTDTVHVSGLLLRRSDRSAPDGVEVRLLAAQSEYDVATSAVPIVTVPVTVSARGSFIADLPLADLPRAQYRVELVVDGKAASVLHVSVTDIRKPAFEIAVRTDRDAYVAGEDVHTSATTTFYDGTPVAGLELNVAGFDDSAAVTSDVAGGASATLVAGFTDQVPYGWTYESVGVHPVRPEEGEISGSQAVLVFPSRVWLTGSARHDGGRIIVDGRLLAPDIEAFADARLRGEDANEPTGPAIGGGRVTVKVVRHVVTQTQVGTRYDFIEKKVVPEYDVTTREVTVGTFEATSGSAGAFRVAVDVPSAEDWYDVVVSAADREGRRLSRLFDVIRPADAQRDGLPYLLPESFCGPAPRLTVGLGQTATVTMHDGDGTTANDGRFLYVVSGQGVVETTVQGEATFRRTLRDRDLPGFTILGVWLTDGGFASSTALAAVDPDDMRITVNLQPEAARYAPGELVTLDVVTTGPDGRPVAADVVLQGVDQKLYAIGAAGDADPLRDLLEPVSSGFLQGYSSHATPAASGDGCGDAGGDREEFVDVVTFQRVATDASGRGSASFRLSDDLTSWHVTGTAMSAELGAGQGSVLVPVGLPFFVEAVVAPDYLVRDEPVIRIRAYGEGLTAGDRVEFRVTSASLGLDTTLTGTAFEAARVQLPALPIGDHDVRIEARASHEGTTLRDAVVRRVHVIQSRLTTLVRAVDVLEAGFTPRGGEGFTTYVITDAGRGSLIALLQELAAASSARYDRAAAAEAARRLLVDEFGMDPGSLPPTTFEPSRYERDGIALLPYSGEDLALTALAALAVPGHVAAGSSLEYLLRYAEAEEGTRESRIVALAGAAGLGADVVPRLREHDVATLTIREQLWLALGLAAAGDHAAARVMERDLLERHGQRFGPWVRLASGASLEDTIEGSALLLVLAAELGDPLAADVARYLLDNPSKERAIALELLAYAERALAWLPRPAGRFAYTVDGNRQEVALEPGGSLTLMLTAPQRATLRFEPLDGSLAVVSSWASGEPALPADPAISIKRTVTPADDAPESGFVRVRIEVEFDATVPAGCYQLTDLLPSGLAPVAMEGGDGDEDPSTVWPYEVEGQRVSWCVDPRDRSRTFGYAARVVSPGTYRWEPAVIQSVLAPGLGAATPETTFTIR